MVSVSVSPSPCVGREVLSFNHDIVHGTIGPRDRRPLVRDTTRSRSVSRVSLVRTKRTFVFIVQVADLFLMSRFPDALNNATSSSIALAQRLSKSSPNSVSALKSALEEHFGLSDASSDEIDALQNADEIWQWDRVLSRMLSSRAEVGWSTHGHSGADVGLYVSGYKEKKLKGSVDNTEVCWVVSVCAAVERTG